MQVYSEYDELPREEKYMFSKLFSTPEIEAGHWFITHMYDRAIVEELVGDLGGNPSAVRSHPDTEDTFFYAIVAK